jgi:AGCS family alanine or glycine:cation symporter
MFAIFTLMASFGIGNSAQGNSITTAVSSTFNVPKWIVGIILVICVGAVVIGGIKSISKVSSVLVPAMAVFYMIAGILVVCINYKNVPSGIANIFSMAFGAKPIAGGLVGTVTASMMNSMRYGIARGVFSNEAGLGTGSIAHACADTKKPVKQGFFGIFEVFVDTIVICTLTALVILCSGVSVGYGEAAGAELTISGFTSTYGGWVSIFTAVAMCCFAFSTIIGWGLYGTRCIEFLFGTKANKPFMVVYSLVAIVGATMNLGLMWSIAETFNGLMVIPNLIAVFLLSGVVVKLVKEYFAGEGAASTVKNSR